MGSTLSVALAITTLLALASPVAAQGPPDFRRTSVYVHPSFTFRHFLGSIGDQSGWGFGVGVTQGVQVGYLGVHVTVDTDYFLSSQSPPPFNSGFQLSGVDISGRFVFPFGDVRPFVDAGYRRVAFVSNALVEVTGPDLTYHGVDGGLGVRLVQLSPFYIEASSSLAWLPGLSDNLLFGATLSLGLRTVL